jgi:hypothetical protein
MVTHPGTDRPPKCLCMNVEHPFAHSIASRTAASPHGITAISTRLRREKWPQLLAPSFGCPDFPLLGGASTSAAHHATLLNGIASHVHYDSPVLISLQLSLPGLLIEMLDFETTASPLFGGPHVLMPLAFACSDELLAIERSNSN